MDNKTITRGIYETNEIGYGIFKEDILMKDLTEANRNNLKSFLTSAIDKLKEKRSSMTPLETKRLGRLNEIINILNNGNEVKIMRNKLSEEKAVKEGLRDIDSKNKCNEFRYDKTLCEADHSDLNCKWLREDNEDYSKLWEKVKNNPDIVQILENNYVLANSVSLELYIKRNGYDCFDVGKGGIFEDIGGALRRRAGVGGAGSTGTGQRVSSPVKDTGHVPGDHHGGSKKKKTKKKKSKTKKKKVRTKKKKAKSKKKKSKTKKKKSKKR